MSKSREALLRKLARAQAHVNKLKSALLLESSQSTTALASVPTLPEPTIPLQVSSESRHKKLIEYSDTHITVVDLEGKILYSIPSEPIVGYSLAEYFAIGSDALVHPDDLPAARDFFQQVQTTPGIPLRIEMRIRHKLGHYIWLEMTAINQCHDPDIRGIVIKSQNIVGRKELEANLAQLQKTQEALRHSEERYRRVIEDQADLICRYNTDFEITFANQPYSALYNMQPQQMVGLNLLELQTPSDHERLRTKLLLLNAANPVDIGEVPTEMADGSVHWLQWTDRAIIDEAGHVLEYQAVGRDITEQKKIQITRDHYTKILEETHQFLQATFDASSAHKAVLDRDGTIIYVNTAWRQFANDNGALSATHFLGKNYLQVCAHATDPYADEASLVAEGIQAVITGRQEEFYKEYPCHSPTEERWYGLTVNPFDEAAPRRVVVAHQNITARVQAEAAELKHRHVAEALRDSVVALTASLDIDGVMRQILNSAETVVHCDASSIILFEGEYGRVAYLRGFTLAAQAALQNYRFPLTESTFSGLPITRQPYWVKDTQAEPQWTSIPASSWIRSSIGIPIELKNEIIGILVADSATPHHFQQADIEKLQTFAHYASLALSNAYQAHTLEVSVAERTAELQAANNHLEAILNNSLDGIFLLGPNLEIQQTNHAFDILFSCPAGSYIGRTLLDLFPAANQAQLKTNLETLYNEGVGKYFEVVVCRTDGTLFHAELSISAVKESGLVCTIHDITDRKQAETALAEERNLLRTLIDALPDYIYVKDTAHRTVISNLARARSFGLTPAETIGKDDFAFVPAHMVVQFHADEDRLFATGLPLFDREEQTIGLDGSVIWAATSKVPLRNVAGEIIGLVGVTRDISERKRAEIALAEERNLLRTMLDALPDFIWIKDRQHRFITHNTAPDHVLYKLRQKDIIGKTDFDLWPSVLAEQFYADEEAIFQANKPLINHVEQVTDRDGHPIWLESNKVPLRNLNGEIIGLAGSTRDITEQKANEAQLRFHACVQESVHEAVLATDLEFRIQSWNHAAESIYGWSAAEVLGKHAREVLQTHFASSEAYREQLETFQSQGWWQGEMKQHRKDGVVLDISSSVTLLKDEKGSPIGVVAVNHDITASKQAAQALRESEARFRQLIEAAPIAIVIADQLGNISLANNQANALFGYQDNELVGQAVELLVPTYAQKHHATLYAAHAATPTMQGMGTSVELFGRRKDGSEFPVEINLSHIETQTDPLVMSFIVDITERKQAALNLEEQRAFLRKVIDTSPNMIFVKDSNGRFVLVNTLVAQMYNTSAEALVGKCDADINPLSQEVENFLVADQYVIASGGPLFIEEPVTGPTGRTRWFQTTKTPITSADGKTKYVLGVATDITERRKMEEEIKQSEHLLRLVVENLPIGVWFIDANGMIQQVNAAGQAIWGGAKYVGLEAYGQYRAWWADSGQLIAAEEWAGARAVLKGETSLNEEIEIEAFDGTHKYIFNSAIPIRDEQHKIQGAIVVEQDITERKQNEQLIRQALQKEQELNELKSRFVSMASHEFRTPLASISALAETLIAYRQRLTDEQIGQRLYKIQEQVGYLKAIMEDVLQLARLQARRAEFNPELVNLDTICRNVIEEFQSHAGAQHTLFYTCDTVLHTIKLDKKLIRQIFSNLLSNAFKYSPQEQPITITLQQSEGVLVLSIADKGIGIPEADLPHLFEPFHRATNVNNISGTGLGLTITQESVELHGGTITVASTLGVGSTFTVRIPFIPHEV